MFVHDIAHRPAMMPQRFGVAVILNPYGAILSDMWLVVWSVV
jgi:isocitrate/isopropylmalate dehydrogenase